MSSSEETAAQINAEIQGLPVHNTPTMRSVLSFWSKKLKDRDDEFILETARLLLKEYGYHWLTYELISNHPSAFEHIGERELQELGHGINSWWTVDSFARTLAGPVWLKRQVSDGLIMSWARSVDPWWRRAAAVSTVALNVRSRGGFGDSRRTLAVCHVLAADKEKMVAKAISWALRELVVHDAEAVKAFLRDHQTVLPEFLKREVSAKLLTGLKNPKHN